MNTNKLTGKIALITGGGRGIGRATALELARQGATIVVAARSQPELEETANEIHALGGEAFVYPVDLTDKRASLALIPDIQQKFGAVSILINNAGIVGPFGPTWTLESTLWEQSMRVNLLAPFWLVHEAIPQMLAQQWGRIVNVSSGVAQNPRMRGGPYAASKAGLDAFTRQLGFELEGTNVIVTAIYPGMVDTAMSASVRAQGPEIVGQVSQTMRTAYAEGKMPTPDMPARLIAAIVLSEESSPNGQVIDLRSEQGKMLVNTLTTSQPSSIAPLD